MKPFLTRQRFWIFPASQLWTIVLLIIGGNFIFLGYSTILVGFVVADLFTDEFRHSDDAPHSFERFVPEVSLVLHVIVFALSTWRVAGIDLANPGELALAAFLAIQAGAMAAHNTVANSHDLMHRNNPRSFFLAQFLAAFSLRTAGVIDHVFGHHRLVGFYEDNSTARLNEGFWRFFFRAIPNSIRFSFRFEADRLSRKSVSALSIRNRQIQGLLCYLPIILAASLVGGLAGLAFFAIAGLWGMILVESGNYISHYGLVRGRGEDIAEAHSWNNYNTLSTSLLLNLSRHSDHHLHPSRSYWSLEAANAGPKYARGFLAMTAIALFPPLFFQLVHAEMVAQNIPLSSTS
ncbi:MAG: fatty acid desaturase [Rhizobiaceae bacterium]